MNMHLIYLVFLGVTARATSLLATNKASVFLFIVCMFLPSKLTMAHMIFDWLQYRISRNISPSSSMSAAFYLVFTLQSV